SSRNAPSTSSWRTVRGSGFAALTQRVSNVPTAIIAVVVTISRMFKCMVAIIGTVPCEDRKGWKGGVIRRRIEFRARAGAECTVLLQPGETGPCLPGVQVRRRCPGWHSRLERTVLREL